MDLRLKGRKAVVTGGTRGIGRAIAETLAREDCDVAICARHVDQVEEAVAGHLKRRCCSCSLWITKEKEHEGH